MKKLAAILLSLVMAVSVTACAKTTGANNGKLKISVTFNAMKEFTEAVGKDKVEITTIIPDGTEPHDFELKPKDMVSITNADILVYNGLNMEKWVNDAIKSSGNTNILSVEAAKGVEPIKNTEKAQEDPHAWLSIKGAETEVKNIADALIKKDAKNADFYKKNRDEYINKLESLYNEYNPKFKETKSKDFVTGHAAFAYFCRDFGLEQKSVQDVFADGEPSAKQMNELIKYCKDNSVKTIFAEEMVSPEVSKTLANSVGAKVETVYTCESSEEGKSYIDRIKSNLEKIYASIK